MAAVVVLMLVVVANLLAGLNRWQAAGERAERLARSRRASGVVIGTEPSGSTAWHPVVQFIDDDGRDRTVRASARGREHWPRPRDTVAIRYDPQDSDWISLEEDKYTGTATRGYAIAYFAWAGAMLVAVVIVLLAAG